MKRLWLGLAVMFVAVVAIVYFVMDRPWASSTLAVDTRVSSVHAPTIEITYIANEGILISAAGKQVLIDGLHREYGPEYAFLPAADRERIAMQTRRSRTLRTSISTKKESTSLSYLTGSYSLPMRRSLIFELTMDQPMSKRGFAHTVIA